MTVNDHRVSALALEEQPDPDARLRRIDHDAVQRAARELLRALGADVDAEALEDTPRRVADAYAELLTPQPFRATTFPNDDGYDELIVARARGVGVVLEAEHLCMSLRGVQKLGAKTVSSALHGLVRDDPRTRQEFLALTTRTFHDQ
jgi:GTP cyclohydrolase I